MGAADIDHVIEERVSRFDNEGLRDSMRSYYRSGQGFDLISSGVLSNKAYERVRAIFSGNAPIWIPWWMGGPTRE